MKGVFRNIKRRFSNRDKESTGLSKSSTRNNKVPVEQKKEDPLPDRTQTNLIVTPSKLEINSRSQQPKTVSPTFAQSSPVIRKKFTKEDLLITLPSFRECIAAEKEILLIRKLKMCCVLFDFYDQSPEEILGKEMKRQLLLELVDYISTTKKQFSAQVLISIMEMITVNLFRSLPPPSSNVCDPNEEEPCQEPRWAHLQVVYEFLLRFIVSGDTDANLVKKYINGNFVLHLLELFNSEDPRERDYLKTILHRIYGKFMSLRSFIRKAINNVFYAVIYETENHNGLSELLEILGSIINGFALPLKPEHKKFLRNVLIPLHKVKVFTAFNSQLEYCISQFIDKDTKLAPVVIGGLLTYWPKTNSLKQVHFLNEIDDVIELTQSDDEIKHLIIPLFEKISLCICCPHFQVAERALYLWNNEYIASMASENSEIVLPIVYPAIAKNAHHQNSTIDKLTLNIENMLKTMNNDLFIICQTEYNRKLKNDDRDIQNSKWEALAKLALRNSKGKVIMFNEFENINDSIAPNDV